MEGTFLISFLFPSQFIQWVELHGDRAGYDDPAIVTGIGSIEGRSYMFIGHQKGRNTKENIQRNFGMPTPHGYGSPTPWPAVNFSLSNQETSSSFFSDHNTVLKTVTARLCA